MGIIDSIKEMFGITPVSVGDLNRHATIDRPKPAPAPPPPDPLAGIEVIEEYKRVKGLLEAGFPIVFVSGKAGTGKSTLIHYIRHSYKSNVVVVAPTGVAALNVHGSTIHSYFHFPPRIINEDDIEPVRDRKLYTKLDLLIVDEISMVRADVIDAMDLFLRKNGRDASFPFGGTQLLLVGDLFQLPPVVTRSEESMLFSRRYTSPYFFSARVMDKCQIAPVGLEKIFRQRDPEFAALLNQVRIAANLDTVVPLVNTACYRDEESDNSILTLTCTNAVADRTNQAELDKLHGSARTYTGEVSGKFAVDDERLPSPLNLALKPGAQVMFTKNSSGKAWVNGTLGKVVELLDNSIKIELITDHVGAVHDVQRETWESFKYTYDYQQDKIVPTTTGKYVQFPLVLAWAVTIHKSQGKTLERVKVDLGTGAFASGQVYVALSRCRSISDIRLVRPIDIRDVKCDQRILRFAQMLKASQNGAQTPHNQLENQSHQRLRDRVNSIGDCPRCGSALKKRNGINGPFIGCSGYPACKFTKNIS